LLLLIESPDQMAAVAADPTLIPRMFEESLRLESPVQWSPRRTTEDTTLGGVQIPAGAFVLVVNGAANRDESHFACPVGFDHARKNATDHLAFGFGNHFCIGAPLARLEGRIAFEQLFARLRDIGLAPGFVPEYLPSPNRRGLRRLDIVFEASAA